MDKQQSYDDLLKELQEAQRIRASTSPPSLSYEMASALVKQLELKISKRPSADFPRIAVKRGMFSGDEIHTLSADKIQRTRNSCFASTLKERDRPSSSTTARILETTNFTPDIVGPEELTDERVRQHYGVNPGEKLFQVVEFDDEQISILCDDSTSGSPAPSSSSSLGTSSSDSIEPIVKKKRKEVHFHDVSSLKIGKQFFHSTGTVRNPAQIQAEIKNSPAGHSVCVPEIAELIQNVVVDGVIDPTALTNCLTSVLGTIVCFRNSLDLLSQKAIQEGKDTDIDLPLISSLLFSSVELSGHSKKIFRPFACTEQVDVYEIGRGIAGSVPYSSNPEKQISNLVKAFWLELYGPWFLPTLSKGRGASESALFISYNMKELLLEVLSVGMRLSDLPPKELQTASNTIRALIHKSTETYLTTTRKQYRNRWAPYRTLPSEFPKHLDSGSKRDCVPLAKYLMNMGESDDVITVSDDAMEKSSHDNT